MATRLPDPRPLTGRRILICRPEPEASRLAHCFREAGADVRVLPLIGREPLPETPETHTLIQNLDHYSHVIAVSPYAASLFMALADNWWPQLPMGIRWYGVGRGTAAVLTRPQPPYANAGPARHCWHCPHCNESAEKRSCWCGARKAVN